MSDAKSLAMMCPRLGRLAVMVPVVLACSAAVPALAVPPCRYTVQTIIGPSCGPGELSNILVRGMNEAGHVVGAYECPGGQPRPFKWSPEGGFQALPLPPGYPNGMAMDIADDGVILGVTSPITLPSTGYLWDGQSFQVFGTLPGGNFSDAAAMNNNHVATGFWGHSGTGPGRVAFRWGRTMQDLTPDLAPGQSRAYDISENGLITGYMGATAFPPNYRAFIWNNGQVTDLGLNLPGAYATEARAVNDDGKACGVWRSPWPATPGFLIRSFFWDGEKLVDLPTGSYVGAFVSDINNSSQIVGNLSEFPSMGGPGCLWEDGRRYSIWPPFDPETGVGLREVYAINDRGQIAANAALQGDDIGAVFTPVLPEIGDTNCDEVVNVDDLLNVINQWRADGGREDFNDDGVVNLLDLFEVIVNWG